MCALAKQSPFSGAASCSPKYGWFSLETQSDRQAAQATGIEFISVVDPRAQGQESHWVAYRVGKSDPPGNAPSRKWSAVETDACVVCTVWMKIRTRVDLKHTKLAMDLKLRTVRFDCFSNAVAG
jgi:hypothetical protein